MKDINKQSQETGKTLNKIKPKKKSPLYRVKPARKINTNTVY